MANVSSSNSIEKYPKLRFDGYNYPWMTRKLGDLGTFIKGAPLSKADISDEGAPFILYGELYTTYSEVTHSVKRKTDKTVEQQFYSKIGDVIMPTSGETPEDIATASCIMLPDVILAGDLLIYRTKQIDGRFVSYAIKNIVNKQISSVAQGKSVVHVRADELSKICITFPVLDEQKKILALLELLDKRIATQQSLIETLKKYKRGLISSLEDRFSNVVEYHRIGDFYKVQGGFAFKSECFCDDGTPVIRISDINEGKVTVDDAVYYPKDIKIDNRYNLQKGDLLIAMSGATTGKTGVCEFKGNAYLNQRVGKFISTDSTMSIEYLAMIVDSDSFSKSLLNLLVAGAQPNISPMDIESIIVPVFNYPIRKTITDILLGINRSILIQEELLCKSREMKAGLLQQLFI